MANGVKSGKEESRLEKKTHFNRASRKSHVKNHDVKGDRHQCGQPNVNLRQVPAQVNE